MWKEVSAKKGLGVHEFIEKIGKKLLKKRVAPQNFEVLDSKPHIIKHTKEEHTSNGNNKLCEC